MKHERLLATVLILGAIITYVGLLGGRALIAPDEFRYAEIPREMIETGEWIVPHLNGAVYFEKPVLGYWVTAVSMLAFGENAFAARLPFAIATLLTAAIVGALVRRSLRDARAGLLAAAIYLTSAFVAGIGTFAVLDALLTLWVTAALASFYIATEHPPGGRRQAWLAACGAACGAAFLTKGFLAFALAAIVAAPYLVWSRRFRELVTLPWTPIAVTALVAAPWSLAVALRDSDYWRYFFWVEHINRFAGGEQAQHAHVFWLYVPVVVAGALPWTFLAVPALWRWRRLQPRSLVRYAACWFVLPFLFFSSASGKLSTYVLPCFAPLVIIIVCGLASMPADRARWHLRGVARGLGVVLALIAVASIVQTVTRVLTLEEVYTIEETWKAYAGASVCLIAGAIALIGSRSSDAPGVTAAIVASVLSVLGSGAFVLPDWDGSKTPQRWIEAHADLIPDEAIVISDSSLFRAVCWCLRRRDVAIVGMSELEYGLQRADQRGRRLEVTDLPAMIADPDRARPIVVIARDIAVESAWLPSPTRRENWRDIALSRFDAPPPALR